MHFTAVRSVLVSHIHFLSVFSLPCVSPSSTYMLEENMTFMADMFLHRGNMGFRWEDGMIVKNGPAEQLSSYGRQLNILEV